METTMRKMTQVNEEGIEMDVDFQVEYEPTYPCARCSEQTAELVKVALHSYCPACALDITSRAVEMVS